MIIYTYLCISRKDKNMLNKLNIYYYDVDFYLAYKRILVYVVSVNNRRCNLLFRYTKYLGLS